MKNYSEILFDKLGLIFEQPDYDKVGLMCGLEIHQQISGHKLFCNCPCNVRNDKSDYVIKRFLTTSQGESGKVDAAALHESKKNKFYLYEGYNDSVCLVEKDEEPPHSINKDALNVAYEVSKALGMSFIYSAQVMRKIVVDGSNTSGFQRTCLLSVNGKLNFDFGSVGIDTLAIEEDSCKKVESTETYTKYNLSRLGIPLIEIATAPDMKSGVQAKEVAKRISMILRSTGKVKRGLGTIRQDVNVSIRNGVRVEIKGVQDLDLIPEMVKQEAIRQINLNKIFDSLKNSGASVDNTIYDLTDLLKDSKSKVLRSSLDKGGVIKAIKLNGYRGYTGLEIQKGRRFGSEISDYAKQSGVKGLFHLDELPNYGITLDEVNSIKSYLKLGVNDSFILIADFLDKSVSALNNCIFYLNRLKLVSEVRNVNDVGSTVFLRPMPGSARMYPETDVYPIICDEDVILKIPDVELLDKRIERVSKLFGVKPEHVEEMWRKGFDLEILFKDIKNLKYSFVLESLFSSLNLFKKKGISIDFGDSVNLSLEVLNYIDSGKITKDNFEKALLELYNVGSINLDNYKMADLVEVESYVKDICLKLSGKPFGAIMGELMKKYKGQVDGKTLSTLIKKYLS